MTFEMRRFSARTVVKPLPFPIKLGTASSAWKWAWVLALLGWSCGFSPWPDRETEENVTLNLNAIEFATQPRRFIVVGDSVLFLAQGIHTGYACTQLSKLKWEIDTGRSGDGSAIFLASIQGTIPSIPDCPREKTRDTLIWATLPNLQAGIQVGLSLKDLDVMDSAFAVKGQAHIESLLYVKNDLNLVEKKPYLYRDSSSLFEAMLYGDSLAPCTFFNWAQGSRSHDSVWISFETVALDSAVHAGDFGCTLPHLDSISIHWRESGI